MISQSRRETLYRELEANFPMRSDASGVQRETGELPWASLDRNQPLPFDLGAWAKVQFHALQESVTSQILYLLHTLFVFPAEETQIRDAVRDCVDRLYSVERDCQSPEKRDPRSHVFSLMRRCWEKEQQGARSDSVLGSSCSLLSGVYHLEQASFFRRIPQEIASWAKVFLEVERYHRSDPAEHEARLDRLKLLRMRIDREPIGKLEDLFIWLEHSLLGELSKADCDVSRLSRRLSQEMEGRISPDLFPGLPLQAFLYILLRTHQFCLSETVEREERARLEKVFSTREFDSLLDLMRVVVQRTFREHGLPEVVSLLDQLQAEGFSIKHEKFRDPYESQLVPLADTERLEKSRLPLFFALDHLSGEFSSDLAVGREALVKLHQHIISEALGELEVYALALFQPLPQANLVQRMIRFATTWSLAQHPWPLSNPPASWEDEIRSILPGDVIRHLVRPRKGYEVTSKQELKRLMEEEGWKQREALERIKGTGIIQGYHDYTQFTRYLLFHVLCKDYGLDLGDEKFGARLLSLDVGRLAGPEWVVERAKERSIDAAAGWAHTLDSIRVYLAGMAPPSLDPSGADEDLAPSREDSAGIYRSLLDEIVPAYYRLAVALGRHDANLPRLALPPTGRHGFFPLVGLLAPSFERLERTVQEGAREAFMRAKAPLYRGQCRPFLLSRGEWEAYFAWEIHSRFGTDKSWLLEVGDLDQILGEMEKAAEQVDVAPGALSVETVRSTILTLLSQGNGGWEFHEEQVIELVRALPQVDCGACGEASCRHFAQSLLRGRAEPNSCVQLSPRGLSHLADRLRSFRESGHVGKIPGSLLDGLSDRSRWLSMPERESFQNVLSPVKRKARRLFLERLGHLWETLSPKPEIFTCPSPDSFHEELVRYLGYESAERLTEDERLLLIAHGAEREEAEWLALKANQDWLILAARNRQGRPLARSQDPEWVAADKYGRIYFLHQLTPKDRRLVLMDRLERYQDGFGHWWNEDLLTLNHPDFSIRDWEDFTKIIKNAYWHRALTLAPGDALKSLYDPEKNLGGRGTIPLSGDLFKEYLLHLVEVEEALLQERFEAMEGFQRRQPVNEMSDLRLLLEALADQYFTGPFSTLGDPASSGDKHILDLEELWERFQREDFAIAPHFACRWEDLSPSEQGAVAIEMGPEFSARDLQGEGAFFVANWGDSMRKRAALVRALLTRIIGERLRERGELEWLERELLTPSGGRPSLDSFRKVIRQRLRQGSRREEVKNQVETLMETVQSRADFLKELSDDLLHLAYRKRARELLPGRASEKDRLGENRFLDGHPELKDVIDRILFYQPQMDRERLLHFLFLLAKMEGNLDTLTALLREIRETSDIIEAAWLRFTEERIVEGPPPKALPGSKLGIPLLVSHLKDKAAVNLCLRNGVSRREKRNVAAAVNELLNFLRYHILVRSDGSESDGLEGAVQDMLTAGYDLSGIEEDALRVAGEREQTRLSKLKSQKIWVYTSVTARKLAAQHPELNEIERQFQKMRLEILKDEEGGDKRHAEVISRRGVALGQIKGEMYRQLSDLLESERIATFQKRIRQIVDQLDERREEIIAGWSSGDINRRTVFYILREYQKGILEPSREDFQRFFTDHWLLPVGKLRSSLRPDRRERIKELDERFQALLGVSLLALEDEVTEAAQRDYEQWMHEQLSR